MLEFYVDSLITIHFFNYHGGVIISDLMINGQIRDKEVRLISADGEQLGIMSSRDAMKLAQEAELDLVKIAPTAKPPVCKIIDYGKYATGSQCFFCILVTIEFIPFQCKKDRTAGTVTAVGRYFRIVYKQFI